MSVSQRMMILKHLKNRGSITSWQAFEEYGATRLSAIIFDLRKMGFDIDDMWEEFVNRYGETVRFKRYFLKDVWKCEQ